LEKCTVLLVAKWIAMQKLAIDLYKGHIRKNRHKAKEIGAFSIDHSQYKEGSALAKKTKLVATSLGSPGRPKPNL
jgi:hypothetical protein